VLGSSETVSNSYKYLGKYGVIADSDAHLYIRARYYSSELGRFTQKDFIKANIKNPLALNSYRYTKGNPISFKDVNGYWAGVDDFIAIVGGAVVGLIGQGASDIISTAIDTGVTSYQQGEFTFQGHLGDWETYTGAAVGGAAAGETLLYTANPILAGAAGGFASSSTKQGLYALQDNTTLSKAGNDILLSTTLGGVTAAIPSASNALSDVKINGSFVTFNTKMQGTIIKGLVRGTTKKVGSATIRKLSTTTAIDGLQSSIPNVTAPIIKLLNESEEQVVLIPVLKMNNGKYKVQK